ncbi:hypothetical protein PR202_ga20142 [Eleusine coracana subsp. coracana]|uniref:Uncharacterized protein n=1 Tax=Eleusine coracana subsp. coracana TaxID=191504 RepID=A0AAV5CXP9_ELECO|nr:hypothetical protein PR202_ga20142 [Eleusine coracana subsp. coracana]
MEALLELEKVQRVLSFISSRGLSDASSRGAAADRFLAQFILFLARSDGVSEISVLFSSFVSVQPFDSLSMERKLLLVSELLRKASPDTLEEVKHLATLEDDQDLSSQSLLQPNKKCKMHEEKLTIQASPVVGFDAMTRANSTLEDFISIEDVMRAIHLKSFDYRVLNLLMYQLTGQQVNDLHMDFLSVSELLVEISDDLYDYEDDVMNNTFNILRMFTAIYGPSEASNMLAKCISEAEEKYDSLSRKLDPTLSGGKISGHAYGTWNIPPIINDEGLFRLERLINHHDTSDVAIR